MRKEVLTEEALNGLLILFLSRLSNSHYNHAIDVFNLLYNFGFRIRELESLHLWQYTDEGYVITKSSKGSNDRFIDANLLPDIVLDSIEVGVNFVYTSTYKTYRSYFGRMKGCRFLSVGDKSIATHVFRHNRIKQYSKSGMSDQQIKEFFGIKNESVVARYRNSQIVATYL